MSTLQRRCRTFIRPPPVSGLREHILPAELYGTRACEVVVRSVHPLGADYLPPRKKTFATPSFAPYELRWTEREGGDELIVQLTGSAPTRGPPDAVLTELLLALGISLKHALGFSPASPPPNARDLSKWTYEPFGPWEPLNIVTARQRHSYTAAADDHWTTGDRKWTTGIEEFLTRLPYAPNTSIRLTYALSPPKPKR